MGLCISVPVPVLKPIELPPKIQEVRTFSFVNIVNTCVFFVFVFGYFSHANASVLLKLIFFQKNHLFIIKMKSIIGEHRLYPNYPIQIN